jgi:hypothetical protein
MYRLLESIPASPDKQALGKSIRPFTKERP